MYSIQLWMLKLTCLLGRIDSESLHKAKKAHDVISPEGFGY